MEDRRGPGQEHEDKTKDRSEDKQDRAKKFGSLASGDSESVWSDVKLDIDDDDEESEESEKRERVSKKTESQAKDGEEEGGRWASLMRSIFERDQVLAREDEESTREESADDSQELSFSDLSFFRPKKEQELGNGSGLDQVENEEFDAPDEEEIELPPIDTDNMADEVSSEEEPEAEQPQGSVQNSTANTAGTVANGSTGSGGGAGNGPTNNHGGAGRQGGGYGGGGGFPPNGPNALNPPGPNRLRNNPNTNNHDPRLRRAIAGLLLVDAIDYLTTKRRENRIKKKNEADHKKLGAVQEKQRLAHEQVAQQTNKLETARNDTEERLKKLESETGQAQQEKIKIEKPPKIPAEVLRVVQEISEVTEKTHEKIIEAQDHELLSTLSERDREILRTEILERPADVLEAVKRAAENNAAVETLYEKRHESRGNETSNTSVMSRGGQTQDRSKTLEEFAAWSGQQSLSTDVKLPELTPKQPARSQAQQQVARTVSTVLIIFVILVLFAVILFM